MQLLATAAAGRAVGGAEGRSGAALSLPGGLLQAQVRVLVASGLEAGPAAVRTEQPGQHVVGQVDLEDLVDPGLEGGVEHGDERLDAPVIKGDTPVKERQRLFDAFRAGEVGLLVVSKVANFSIDLPSAEVAIQVSGSFGSRQEEAQRLGRLLRPKSEGKSAHFYTIVSRDTVDADFAQNRQRFLAEQGYAYRIVDAEDLRDVAG